MRKINLKISWLAILPILVLSFAFKAAETSTKIEIKSKTIVVLYTLVDDTHVMVNITDKDSKPVEVLENSNDVTGSYKATYKLNTYAAGEYNVNVLFNGNVISTKSFTVPAKHK